MKSGVRKFGAATCKVVRTVQVPAHMRDHVMELSSVHVPAEERRQGFASKLVGLVCDEADADNKLLLLHVQPFGEPGMCTGQLERWYAEQFGFTRIQERPLLMARAVGSTPRFLETLNPIAQAVR
jgi:N-acetylglutamate synthase-like GNAT family acetyltransferase